MKNSKISILLISIFLLLIVSSINAQCISGDCKEGFGSKIFEADTSKYIGQFRNNVADGIGKLYWSNGKISFDGTFKNDNAWEGISYNNKGVIDGIIVEAQLIEKVTGKELFENLLLEYKYPKGQSRQWFQYVKDIIALGKKNEEIAEYHFAEEEKAQNVKIEALAMQKAENERNIKIKNNSNYLKWVKGDKICNEIEDEIILGIIDDWNENKSKAKIKVIQGPDIKYDGEQLVLNGYMWVATKGKGWRLCLDEDITLASETNSLKIENLGQKANIQPVKPEGLTFEMKTLAGKYTKLAGKQIMYKCRNYGPNSLNTEIGEIKYMDSSGGGFLVDVSYTWNDQDMANRNSPEMYKGTITFDQYGCNGAFLITAKNNSGSFWTVGKQGKCYYDIPAKDKPKYNQIVSGANWFMNIECVE